MSNSLPHRPLIPPFPLQERIDLFKANRLGNSHIAPYGPKLKGKKPYTNPSALPPHIHSKAGHALRSLEHQPTLDRIHQQPADAAKKKCEEIVYGKKPIFEHRLTALPPPTYTPIVHKPILLDFDKLTTSDLIKIFTSKVDATLKRLKVFEILQLSDKVNASHVNDLHHLIERLQHLKRVLSDIAKVRVRSELQG